jgi:hypothetical protein
MGGCLVQRGSRASSRAIATRFMIFLPELSPAKNRDPGPRKSGRYGLKGIRYLLTPAMRHPATAGEVPQLPGHLHRVLVGDMASG